MTENLIVKTSINTNTRVEGLVEKISKPFASLNSVFILYLLLLASQYSYTRSEYYQPIFIMLIGFSLFFIISLIYKVPYKYAFISVLTLGVFLRIVYAVIVPTIPFSDFENYHTGALLLSQNIPVLSKNFGFISILSLGYRVYPEIITGKIINAVASCLSLLLVYEFTNLIFNKPAGIISMLLLSISVSDINMVSVIGTETMAQLCLLSSLTFGVIAIKQSSPRRAYLFALLSGVTYGIGFTIRSSLVFFFLFFVMLYAIFSTRKIIHTALFCGGIIMSLSLVVLYYSSISGKLSIDPLKTQDSFPVLSGTNFASDGGYNLEDAELYYSWDSSERNRLAREVAIARITENPIGFATLIPRKFNRLFASNDYGNVWSLGSIEWEKYNVRENIKSKILRLNSLISQSIYVIILFFALFGSIKGKKVSFVSGLNTQFASLFSNQLFVHTCFLGIFVCLTLPHIILEVQPRYHHYLIPLIIPFASIGILKILFVNRTNTNPSSYLQDLSLEF